MTRAEDAEADWLDDAEVTARRLVKSPGQPCANGCGRVTPSADKARCAHRAPVCDVCWPEGCAACTARHERDVRRATDAALAAAAALQAVYDEHLVDDLAAAKLGLIDYRLHQDLARHLARARGAITDMQHTLDTDRSTT